MEQLTLKPRPAVEDAIENWDDDEDLQGLDDLHFRNVSSTTVGSQPNHRDSISSRLSARSDKESVGGGDEDWQVLLPTDDEKSTADAISSAMSAGIPIPQNVPTSALLGGTIKRLGGKRIKKVLGDDWGEDIEMPKIQDGGLKLRKNDASGFQDSMRQFSAEFPSSLSPAKPSTTASFMERIASATKLKSLDKFRDEDDDFGDVPTIKLAKTRTPQKPINFIPRPSKAAAKKEDDNLEDDFEFPDDGQPLRLSTQRETPKTPASQLDDTLDMEWAEGSLGTRFGGTRRDVRSNPSSSVSAFSPSASSRLTGGESEDEGLDDLILPAGPFRFEEALKKRLDGVSPEPVGQTAPKPAEESVANGKAANDDFFSGIDIGDGEVFDSGKLTLNRNIKTKEARQKSPTRRTAMSVTFTNKIEPGISKIPRPQSHDRPRSNLEPVSESGGPVPHYRRPGSRMLGHSAQSSMSSIPTPSTPSHSQTAAPSTPSRRGLNTSASRETLKTQPSGNNGFLKSKRSMPAMGRSQQSPARTQPSYQRPPSRGGDYGSRQNLPSRPKTPIDRSGAESSLANARKPPVPFLPAGMSQAQSHHISTKSSRHSNNRPSSSDSKESMPVNRPLSRLANMYRPTTPTTSNRSNHAPEALLREAASKRTLTKPTRRRAFGDGNELEIFDDLPTSASSESKFMKQPIARGAPKSVQMRSKLGMHGNNSSNSSINEHPPPPQTPLGPLSPVKQDSVPRFARDTNASRLAREHRIGSVSAALHGNSHLPTVRETGGPLSALSTNFNKPGPPAANSKHLASPMPHRTKKINKYVPPQKPRLIKPMNEAAVNSAKTLKGMAWNPTLCRWEGNENALAHFDAPPQLLPSAMGLASPKSPSAGKAPALIANVGASKGVQMSGGMVFDPARMCWLKMGLTGSGLRGGSGSNTIFPDTAEEDEDPFAGLDDLEDGPMKAMGDGRHESFGASGSVGADGGRKKLIDEEEDLSIGEEFDVGPEFVRRQRVEEERWRGKVAGWVGEGVERDEGTARRGWKWDIREKAVELRGMI